MAKSIIRLPADYWDCSVNLVKQTATTHKLTLRGDRACPKENVRRAIPEGRHWAALHSDRCDPATGLRMEY